MAGASETAPTGDRTVRLEVPAQPGYVVLARLALSAVCRLTPLDDEDVADLKLAVTEAASAFVGEVDEEERRRPLQPVPDPGGGRVLSFDFGLADGRLALEISCPGGMETVGEDRELSRAIIAATVDECRSSETSMTLVKYLSPSGQ